MYLSRKRCLHTRRQSLLGAELTVLSMGLSRSEEMMHDAPGRGGTKIRIFTGSVTPSWAEENRAASLSSRCQYCGNCCEDGLLGYLLVYSWGHSK
jgi:hypothetical protein